MAINPSIIRGIGVNNNSSVIDIFQNAMNSAQNRGVQREQLGMQKDANVRANQNQAFTNQANEQALAQAGQQRILKSVNDFAVSNAPLIQRAVTSGDPSELQQALVKRRAQLQQQGLPTDQTDEGIFMLGQGNIKGVVEELQGAVSLYNQGSGSGDSAAQRERNQLIRDAQDPNATDIVRNSAKIALGVAPTVRTTAAERIATNETLGQQVVAQKGAEAGAVEENKLKKQLNHKPAITKAVKLAEKAAIESGEVLTDLSRMEAALPGLKVAVGELLELSDVATSTLGGKAIDFMIKESGFGSTKGADARAKLVAIVDNQVLPLLKETFGAAFTVQEGENLKASLVDPDASPSQKREQLTAFLAQKERNIRTKQNQLGENQNVQVPAGGLPAEQATQPQIIRFDAQGNIIQ